MNDELMETLKGNQTGHIPIWLMRQAGRYLPEYRETRSQAGGFLDLCYTPDLACEVTLQPIRRFDLDAAIIFSDILVVPHALGQKLWFEEGEGPRLNPILSMKDLPDWDENQFLKFLSPVFEAIDKTRSALPNHKSLIGFSGAPWTLACYMINGRGSRDYQNVRVFARQNPEIFQEILNQLVQAVSIYLIEKVKAGVNVLQIFDSWAGVLSADEFQHYSINPTCEIINNIRKVFPDIPIIGFPRGAGMNYQSYIDQTGIDAVSCDQTVPLNAMKDMQKTCCVQGNLDNVLLLQGGDVMIDQVKKICESLKDGPLIFNLGHGVIKETNPDHVQTVIDTIRLYQKDKKHAA